MDVKVLPEVFYPGGEEGSKSPLLQVSADVLHCPVPSRLAGLVLGQFIGGDFWHRSWYVNWLTLGFTSAIA